MLNGVFNQTATMVQPEAQRLAAAAAEEAMDELIISRIVRDYVDQ